MIVDVTHLLERSADDKQKFRYICFSGMKGQIRELIVVRLPHTYSQGKELDTLAKASQRELQGGKTTQWEQVYYLGGFNNCCWSGTVALQHLPPTPNTYLIAKGDIGQ